MSDSPLDSELLSKEIRSISESERGNGLNSRLPIPAPDRIPYPWDNSRDDEHSLNLNIRDRRSSDFDEGCCGDKPRTVSQNSLSSGGSSTDYRTKQECDFNISGLQCNDRLYSVISDIDNLSFSARNKCYSEVRTTAATTSEFPRTQYPLFELHDRIHPCEDQSNKFPESPVPVRVQSPSSASSITSGRRLEWDSGADVGYIYTHDNYENNSENLSTIERLALVRGCSAALFKRLDPEGTSGPPKPVTKIQSSNVSFNTPLANSTPFSKRESLLLTQLVKESTPEVEEAETVLPGGCLYVHCDEEFENDVAPVLNTEENSNGDKEKRVIANLNKKLSNSLINLRSNVEENIEPNSLFRSQSVLNLSDEKGKQMIVKKGEMDTLQEPQALATTCSVSSSSVATIVQKTANPKTCDKIIQTLPLKLSVGVQVSENSDFHSVNDFVRNSISKRSLIEGKLDERPNIISSRTSNGNSQNTNFNENEKNALANKIQSFKCTGAYRKGSSDSGACLSHRHEHPLSSSQVEQNVMSQIFAQINKDASNSRDGVSSHHLSDREIGTSESATSSNQTGRSYEIHQSESGMRPIHSNVGVVDSANSFEYLPGEVFEQSFRMASQTCGQLTALNLKNPKNISPVESTKDSRSQNISKSNTLSKCVEEGIELLQSVISGKAFKGKMKKKLIQEIVNKLINSDKIESDAQCSTGTTQSSRSSVVSHPQSNGITRNAMKQHLCTEDRAEEEKRSMNSECSSRSIGSEHSNRSLGESALEMSEEAKTSSELNEVPSEKHSSNTSCTPSGSVSVPGDNEHSRGDSSELSSLTFSNNYRRNWKIPTSKAEKVFESHRVHERREESVRSSDFTPPLLKLCKTEHVKQLEWIKFEINHLTRLKQLLEKQEGITKSLTKLASQENHQDNSKKNRSKLSRKLERNNYDDPSNRRASSRNDISETSENACYHESSSSNHHQSVLSEISPSSVNQEVRNTNHCGLNSSPHSLMQGSYILSDLSEKFDKEVSVVDVRNDKRGQMNAVLRQSRKSKERSRLVPCNDIKISKGTMTNFHLSHEAPSKCCCECKKALNAIAMRRKENPSLRDEHVHTFCKCHFMDINSNQNSLSGSYYEFPAASESGEGQSKKTSSKKDLSSDVLNQKCPGQLLIGKKAANVKRPDQASNVKNKFRNEERKLCPCCGRFERDTFVTDDENVQFEGRNATNLCSDAMVQANIKEPLAYLLTFQPSSIENRGSRNSLPEIKLLVPPIPNTKKQTHPKTCGDSAKENQCPLKNNCDSELNDQQLSDPGAQRKHKLTLQEYLKTNRPDYIEQADKRSQCLADLALLRDMRKQKRLELLKLTRQPESTEAKDTTTDTTKIQRAVLKGISVPGKRVFSSQEMRDHARNKYQRSREVQSKIAERKKKEDFRTNRLMAELFTKNLQKRALRGIVNHSYSASLSSC